MKGACWAGMLSRGGSDGNEDLAGVGRTGLGAALRGSTSFRYVVKTSGSSFGDL